MSKTAILVDGGFYRVRDSMQYGYHSAEESARALSVYCHRHLKEHELAHDLYRIFYYDCPPSDKQVYHPLLKKDVDLKKTATYKWTIDFFNCLRRTRKLALRLGQLDIENSVYTLSYSTVKKLCAGKLQPHELTENDFVFTASQKGVDMKIGIDIATLAYNKLVDQIVVIGNDRDYVPAFKLARTAGIDIILDTLNQNLGDSNPLVEHIDGFRSCGNPYAKSKRTEE